MLLSLCIGKFHHLSFFFKNLFSANAFDLNALVCDVYLLLNKKFKYFTHITLLCVFGIWQVWNFILSHSNPCFPCNIAIMNFLVSNMCDIRFHDVINQTVHMFTLWRYPTQKFQNMAKWVCFGTLLFNIIPRIHLCDKKNLTFIDCFDKILLNLSWKGLLNKIFQDLFNKISSSQLTHDRSYVSSII